MHMKTLLKENYLRILFLCTATIIATSFYLYNNRAFAEPTWNPPTGPPTLIDGETAPRSSDPDTNPEHNNTRILDQRSNPHAAFKENTNACAHCHSTHMGKSANLLRESTRKDLCFSCHDGRGSKYDSKGGLYYSSAGTVVESLAGGFNTSAGFTSTHMIEDNNIAPGGTQDQIMLVCTSCHNPHGTGNYRNLATEINGVTIGNHNKKLADARDGIFVASKLDPKTNLYQPDIRENSFTKAEVVSYGGGFDKFCSTCHKDYVFYHYEGTDMNDPTKYRHPVGALLTGGSRTTTTDPQEMPLSYTYPTSLFTTLPTEGVPSGVYPLPKSSVSTTGGTLGVTGTNKYWYIITGVNMLGESHQGYIKGISVTGATATNTVNLVYPSISNALSYKVYRAGPSATEPSRTDFGLIASTTTATASFTYDPIKREYTFKDIGSVSPDTTKNPPAINKQEPLDATSQIGINAPKIMCLTCHFSHGTKSHDYYTGESKLKRKNSMGVCQDCHKK
ncbi:MAG: doubled protein [Bacillales bacterium]|nr:doubled protein [Bacillales bacterium]